MGKCHEDQLRKPAGPPWNGRDRGQRTGHRRPARAVSSERPGANRVSVTFNDPGSRLVATVPAGVTLYSRHRSTAGRAAPGLRALRLRPGRPWQPWSPRTSPVHSRAPPRPHRWRARVTASTGGIGGGGPAGSGRSRAAGVGGPPGSLASGASTVLVRGRRRRCAAADQVDGGPSGGLGYRRHRSRRTAVGRRGDERDPWPRGPGGSSAGISPWPVPTSPWPDPPGRTPRVLPR